METKLFTTAQVKKFFRILDNLDRHTAEIYKGYYGGNFTACQKQVFVSRTLNKWFSGKHIIFLDSDDDYKMQHKRYLYISSVQYALGWSEELYVNCTDYGNPREMFPSIKITHNRALNLEGFWSEDTELFQNMLKMFLVNDLPEREFVFKIYDFNLQTNEEVTMGELDSTLSVTARTHHEAQEKARQIEKQSKGKIMVYGYPDKQ